MSSNSIKLSLVVFTNVFFVVFIGFNLLDLDLALNARITFVVLLLAISLWITEIIPAFLTGLLAITILGLFADKTSVANVFIGFSNPITLFLFGVLGMGVIVREIGLGEKMAYILIGLAKSNPILLFFQTLLSFVVLTFFIPSATTRNAILVPVYDEVFSLWNIDPSGGFGKAITLSLGSLNRLASSAVLTGGIAPIAAAGLLDMNISWFKWFVLLSIPYYFILFIGGLFLFFIYRKGFQTVEKKNWNLEKTNLNSDQIKVIVLLLFAGFVWFTDSFHDIHPAIPILIANIILILPKFGVVSWKVVEQGIDWGTIILIAASFSLDFAITDSGLANWIKDITNSFVELGSDSTFTVLLLLTVVCSVIRFLIPNIVGYLAIVIPVATLIGTTYGIDPIITGLMALILGDGVVFYVSAGTSGILVFGKGNVPGPEIFRFALLMLLVCVSVVLFVGVPWWTLNR